jgi:hypothetical protein
VPEKFLTDEQRVPKCTELQSGDSILEYWFGDGGDPNKKHILKTGEAIAILFLFYAVFHVVSYAALRALVKKKAA